LVARQFLPKFGSRITVGTDYCSARCNCCCFGVTTYFY
jgi:hypothetical protein